MESVLSILVWIVSFAAASIALSSILVRNKQISRLFEDKRAAMLWNVERAILQKPKSFVYLDVEKMYSLSSQMFYGVTEYFYKHRGSSRAVKNIKSDLTASNVLAEIMEETNANTEKKSLHDFAFIKFEDELKKITDVKNIDSTNISDCYQHIKEGEIVRITGRALFKDSESISSLVKGFNEIGESVSYFSNRRIYEEIYSAERMKEKTNDKALISQIDKKINTLHDLIKEKNIESGVTLPTDLVEHMSRILSYSDKDNFEILLEVRDQLVSCVFTCALNKSWLKEPWQVLLRKYSRNSHIDFTVLGIVTHADAPSGMFDSIASSVDEGMRGAILNMFARAADLETVMNGRMPSEYVIDPISVFVEIA